MSIDTSLTLPLNGLVFHFQYYKAQKRGLPLVVQSLNPHQMKILMSRVRSVLDQVFPGPLVQIIAGYLNIAFYTDLTGSLMARCFQQDHQVEDTGQFQKIPTIYAMVIAQCVVNEKPSNHRGGQTYYNTKDRRAISVEVLSQAHELGLVAKQAKDKPVYHCCYDFQENPIPNPGHVTNALASLRTDVNYSERSLHDYLFTPMDGEKYDFSRTELLRLLCIHSDKPQHLNQQTLEEDMRRSSDEYQERMVSAFEDFGIDLSGKPLTPRGCCTIL
jgi:hypothetical protein